MRFVTHCIILFCCLCTACSGAAQATNAPTPTTAPSTLVVPIATPTTTLAAAFLQFKIPSCEGIDPQPQPIKFAWPNIDQRIQELKEASWGYFRCPQPQAAAAAFYRKEMPKPPYNMQETNWVEHVEGSVGVYYNSALQDWTYLWIVPVPGDDQSSYIIIAQNSTPMTGEC